MKALIIDGDANFLYGLQTKFVINGLEVETHNEIGGLEEIIHLARIGRFSLIIADLELPNIDGLAVLEKIKNEPELAAVPLFIFTSIKDEKIKGRALNLGADYFFNKDDLGLDEFVRKVMATMLNRDRLKMLKHGFF